PVLLAAESALPSPRPDPPSLAAEHAELDESPCRPGVVHVKGISIVERAPCPIVVLDVREPPPRAASTLEEASIATRLVGREQTKDHLPSVEDDRRGSPVHEEAGGAST